METTVSERIVRWVLLALIIAVPLAVFPWSGDALEVHKQTLLIVGVAVAGLVWVGSAIRKGKTLVTHSAFNWLLFAWVFITLLSSLLAGDRYGALAGTAGQISTSFVTVLFLAFAAFFVLNAFTDSRSRFMAAGFFVGASGIATVLGLAQAYGLNIFGVFDGAIVNTIGTSVSLAIFAGAGLVLSLGMLFTKVSERMFFKIACVAQMVLALWYLVAVDYTGVWIAMIVGLLVMLGAYIKLKEASLKRMLAVSGLMLVALVFTFVNLPIGASLPLEVALRLGVSSDLTRQITMDGFNGIIGTGPGSFAYDYARFKPADINASPFWSARFSKSGSEFLTTLTNTGAFGLAAVLALFLYAAYRGVRYLFARKDVFAAAALTHATMDGAQFAPQQDGEGKMFSVALLGAFIFMFVGAIVYTFTVSLWFSMLVVVGLLLGETAGAHRSETVLDATPARTIGFACAMMLFIFVLVAGVLMGTGRYVAEAYYSKGALVADAAAAERYLEKAIALNPFEDRFYRDLAGVQLAQLPAIFQEKGPTSPEAQVAVQELFESARKPVTLNPVDANNWALLASMYQTLIGAVGGVEQFALVNYQAAVDREPLNPVFLTELGRIYLSQYDVISAGGSLDGVEATPEELVRRAEEVLNRAVTVKPDYAQGQFELGMLLNRQGKLEEAIARLETVKQLGAVDTGLSFQLGLLYYRTNSFERAKAELEQAVSLDPSFSNARYFLGILLDHEGKPGEAISQFETIASLNPDNPVVEQILNNLRAGQPALGIDSIGGQVVIPVIPQ